MREKMAKKRIWYSIAEKNKSGLSQGGNSAGTLTIVRVGRIRNASVGEIFLALRGGEAYCRSWPE